MTEVVDETGLEVVAEIEDESEPSFEDRVERLMSMIQTDASVRDRMLCEIYVAFTDMDRAMRAMMESGGPMKMMMNMMKGGRG